MQTTISARTRPGSRSDRSAAGRTPACGRRGWARPSRTAPAARGGRPVGRRGAPSERPFGAAGRPR